MNNIDPTKFGFTKSENKIWVFYEDWHLSSINPEYGYYLTASLHIPIEAYLTDSFESKLCKIYLHRSSNIASKEYKNKGYDDFNLIYYGLIESQEDLTFLLNKLGVLSQNQTNDKRDS